MIPDLKALSVYIEKTAREWKTPGLAVAIVKNDNVLFAKGFGVRRLGRPSPVDERTVFPIASCTKAFTAAALALFVDDGRIRWDDPVTTHLRDLHLQEPSLSRRLTVRDLLCHRSGLPKATGDHLWFATTYPRSEILRRLRYLKPRYAHRQRFEYENLMFIAAGQIVPAVAGKSWDAFLKERIFLPLGMSTASTSITALKGQGGNVVSAHVEIRDEVRPAPLINVDNLGPAGSINASVLDIAQWLKLLLNQGVFNGRQIVSSTVVQEMWKPQIALAQSAQGSSPKGLPAYGLGWFLDDYQGRRVVEHGGGLVGVTAQISLLPQERLGVVVLSNKSYKAISLPRLLANRIFSLFVETAAKDAISDYLAYEKRSRQESREMEAGDDSSVTGNTRRRLDLDRFTGVYANRMYGNVKVSIAKGKLMLFPLPSPSLVADLEPLANGSSEFRVRWHASIFPNGLATFVPDAKRRNSNTVKIDFPNADLDSSALTFHRISGWAAASPVPETTS